MELFEEGSWPCAFAAVRVVFEFLAPLTRAWEKRSMKREIRVRKPIFDKEGYQTNLPKSLAASMKSAVPVDPKDIEWLPSPEELAEMRKTTKVSLHLSKRSLKFLKSNALKYWMPYQALIRSVVDKYTEGMEKTV